MDDVDQKAYIQFVQFNQSELKKLLLILDDDFKRLKEIIQIKINDS